MNLFLVQNLLKIIYLSIVYTQIIIVVPHYIKKVSHTDIHFKPK